MRRLKPEGRIAGRLLIAGFLLVLSAFLFFWHLGSLTPGLSPAEYRARQNSHSAEQIVRNGIDAPYYLLQHGSVSLFGNNFTALRLASAVMALVMLLFLFLMLRSLFGLTIGLFALLVAGTAPWAMLAGRSAAPYIMMLWLVVPVASFVLFSRAKKHPEFWWFLLCASAALSLYTPGLIWFALGAAALYGRRFATLPDRINSLYLISGLTVAILLLIPLAASLAVEPHNAKQLLLLPNSWPGAIELLRSLGWAASGLFWSVRYHIDIGIARLPLLNILQLALLIFGFYALGSRMRLISLSLGGWLLLTVILSGLNNDPHLLLLGLPAAGVLIAAGLRLLYIEWRRIFPLNPFSYALALLLIALVVGANLLYGVRYTLVAWPRTPETKVTYVLK